MGAGKAKKSTAVLGLPEWARHFDNTGAKAVSKTDKAKLAYVPDLKQKRALKAAGLVPADRREIKFRVIGADGGSLKARYYESERKDPDRRPEERLGLEIIGEFADKGDVILIANRGSEIFVCNLSKLSRQPAPLVIQQVAESLAATARRKPKALMAEAARVGGPPKKRVVTRTEYDRDPIIGAAALLRASGKCEMPGCNTPLFLKRDGTHYLEVHHIIPLSEKGHDTLLNVAALCPSCHRELHFGKRRKALRLAITREIEGRTSPKTV